jgi:hypothetical protein
MKERDKKTPLEHLQLLSQRTRALWQSQAQEFPSYWNEFCLARVFPTLVTFPTSRRDAYGLFATIRASPTLTWMLRLHAPWVKLAFINALDRNDGGLALALNNWEAKAKQEGPGLAQLSRPFFSTL